MAIKLIPPTIADAHNPTRKGLIPKDFIFWKFVLKPTPANAATRQNSANFFMMMIASDQAVDEIHPNANPLVLMPASPKDRKTAIPKKPKIKMGNSFVKLVFSPLKELFFAFRA